MTDLNISSDFTVDDIHKIREYHHVLTKDMDTQKMKEYYKDCADIVQEHINEKRNQRLNR